MVTSSCIACTDTALFLSVNGIRRQRDSANIPLLHVFTLTTYIRMAMYNAVISAKLLASCRASMFLVAILTLKIINLNKFGLRQIRLYPPFLG